MSSSFGRAAVAAIFALTVLAALPAYAHHSFSAMYDAKKPVRLQGRLTKVEWTNPHSYFHLEVKGKDGTVTTWACEGAGPGALSRRGFNKSDIKVGDTLIVDGYLAKSGGKVIDARRITLPNGRIVSGGTPGDGGPQGTGPQATGSQGTESQGTGPQGTESQGSGAQATGAQGSGAQATGAQGTGAPASRAQGTGAQASRPQSAGTPGAGQPAR